MGYAGGTISNPTYRALGDHTETVQIDYDPSKIPYEQLLRTFWTGHDPTYRTWSRQYASIIFAHDEEQRRLAEESKTRIERERDRTMYTTIILYQGFTLAEVYHQKHSLRQFTAFEEEFARIYPSFPDFLASTAVARVNGYLGGEGSYEDLQREADELGLSPMRKEDLLMIVRRHRSGWAYPAPDQAMVPGTR